MKSLTWRPGFLLLGLWLLFLATNAGRNATNDVVMRQIVARRIWQTGSIALTTIPSEAKGFAWVPAGPGRWVAPYGIGQSLLFVPFDVLGALMERIGPASWHDRIGWMPLGLLLLPLLALGCWLALRALLTEWGLEGPWPVVGASVMMLATLLFHYAGEGQEELLVGTLLTLAMLFAVRLRRSPTWQVAAMVGVCAGAAFVTRSVSMFGLLVLPPLVLSAGHDRASRLRLLAMVGIAAAVVGSISLFYNYARFGSPFVVGYDRLGHFSKVMLDARSPKIFATLLFGPGIGLFILSPALLIGFFGVGDLWRRDRWYAIGAVLALGACYLFFSAWHDSYTGGVAWGTRYQTHLVPILALPVTLGLRHLVASRRGRRAAVIILAVSVAIQVLSVLSMEGLEYYQASCDPTLENPMDAPMQTSLVDGQLRRRVDNTILWLAGRSPPPVGDAVCRANESLMWHRYMPNFWGPVYARRVAHGGGLLVAFWLTLLVTAVALVTIGIATEVRGSRAAHPLPSGR